MRIHGLVALGVLCVVACKKQEATTETKALSAPRNAEGPFERLYLGIPESKYGCDDFDYFPDGGMRNLACHLKTVLSYEELQKIAPKIWRGGPHGSVRLRLDAEDDFGRYDPAFVKWLVDNAIPGAKDPRFRAATQAVYDRYLKNLATVYMRAAVQLKQNPALVERERKYLEAYLAKPEGQRPLDKLSSLEPKEMYNLYAPALAFWLRRRVDGTAATFGEGLRRLMTTYDADSVRRIDGMDLAVKPEATGSASVMPDGPIDSMIDAAWKRVGATSLESGCPDQFEYRPGGMRVGYCYVASLLDFSTIQKKFGGRIFVKGPHGDTLNLHAERDFGHYNPDFVRWLNDHAIPAAKNPVLRMATQSAYDDRFRVAARAFWAARMRLMEDRGFFDAEKKKYLRYIEAGGDKPYWSYWESMPGAYEAQAIGGTGIAFWLRRSIDGTDTLFSKILEKLLKTYDADFYREVCGLRFEALMARPKLFEPPADPAGTEASFDR